MYEATDICTTYHSVNAPNTFSWPNKYKYPIHYDEKDLGGKYIGVHILGGELLCVDHGTYLEPPVYEVDWQEVIIVQPKLKYWGKGIK